MVRVSGEPNTALVHALAEAGWTPYELARRINVELGAGYVHRTTPRSWCAHGVIPRPPLPDLVARILGKASGRILRPRDLWPGIPQFDTLLPADADLGADDQEPWLHAISDLSSAEAPGETLRFMCVSGADVLAFIQWWTPSRRCARAVATPEWGTGAGCDPILEHLSTDLVRLRTIDDHTGGQRLLTVVAHQQRLLVQLALQHGEGSAAAVDLLHQLAQYSQFAGWLAMDLDQHARAQRSFLLGLRLAQFVGDDDLVAVIISCLAVQSLNRAALSDAVDLARRASAVPCASDTAAIVWMRRGRASAALGEVREADRSFERATTLLAQAETGPRRPWSYWLTDDIMAAEQGRCFVDLGRSRPAQIVLARTVHRNGDAGRDRVLYGAALAQAHLAAGELDQACDELHRTTALLTTTSSHRCRSLLQGIVDNLSSCRLPARHQDLVTTAAHTLTSTVEETA